MIFLLAEGPEHQPDGRAQADGSRTHASVREHMADGGGDQATIETSGKRAGIGCQAVLFILVTSSSGPALCACSDSTNLYKPSVRYL